MKFAHSKSHNRKDMRMLKWVSLTLVALWAIGVFTFIAVWNEQVRKERKQLMTASREELGPPKVAITGIERVFYHEPGRYSFLVRQGDGVLRVVKPLYPGQDSWITCNPSIIDDISSGSSMTAEWWGDDSGTWRYEIHVRSVNDIDGGAWSRGKFGHGHTQVLR